MLQISRCAVCNLLAAVERSFFGSYQRCNPRRENSGVCYFTLQSAVYHSCRDDCLAGVQSAVRQALFEIASAGLTVDPCVEDNSRAFCDRRPSSGARRSAPVLCSLQTSQQGVHEAGNSAVAKGSS